MRSHTCLRREIDHTLRLMILEGLFDSFAVGDIDAQMGVTGVARVAREAGFLYCRVVVIVVVVYADDRIATLQQPKDQS